MVIFSVYAVYFNTSNRSYRFKTDRLIMSLSGKSAVITGGIGGIGILICKELFANGVKVISQICD